MVNVNVVSFHGGWYAGEQHDHTCCEKITLQVRGQCCEGGSLQVKINSEAR